MFDHRSIDRNEALRVAFRMVRDRDAAQDLVQAAMLRAWQNREQYREHASGARAWFYRLMRNVFISGQRRSRVEEQTVTDPPTWAADRTVTQSDEQSVNHIHILISNLPETMRAVVDLRATGYDYASIARICKVPIGTVMSRLYRARERLMPLI